MLDRACLMGSRGPSALRCLRQVLEERRKAWSFQQLRGKKKSSKEPVLIKVRLLKNVPRYGRQGAIIPIAAGRMRNDWYPRRVAEYMTETALRDLNLQDSIFERNYGFQPHQRSIGKERHKDVVEEESPGDTGPSIELHLLSPTQSARVMSEAIPQTLEFHRQPNSSSTTSYLPKHSSETGEPAAALSPTASDQRVQADSLSIYGSVSALDIIKYIKTKLDESPDGARVVPLSSEDIRFTSTLSEVEPERIKHLGEFEVEIKLKGSQEPILRTIKVLPEI